MIKVEKDDIIFGTSIIILLAVWYFSLLIFNSPIISIIYLWTSMTSLSFIYVYIYRKRKRSRRILKIRFFASAIPIYSALIYYIYRLVIDKNLPQGQIFLPFFIVIFILFLNAIILYFYEIKKSNM